MLDEVLMSDIPQPPPRSLLVSLVGTLNILAGLIGLFLGLFLVIAGPELLSMAGISLQAAPSGPGTPTTPPPRFLAWLILTATGIGLALLAVVLLTAGLAIHRRLAWGRTLTLIVAVCCGPAATLSLLNQDIAGASTAILYNLLVFAVLLTPQGAAEFGSARRAA
jgi:hypothetical protein